MFLIILMMKVIYFTTCNITKLSPISTPCVETLANTVRLLGSKIQQLIALYIESPSRSPCLTLQTEMNASGKGLVALYLHRRGEQWMWQSVIEQVKS